MPRHGYVVVADTRDLPWSYLLVVLFCGAVLATGFFFAARQHFTSMDLGMKNSKLRKQVDDLEAEKRRLLLAKEIALSPFEIGKASRSVVPRTTAPAVQQIALVQSNDKAKGDEIIKTAATKPTVEAKAINASFVEPAAKLASPKAEKNAVITKERKERTEIAALAKYR
jgi:hypothetical protein